MAIIKTDGGYNALPISYKRGNPIPLDTTAVWYDFTELETYAKEGVTAYVGQVLAHVDTVKKVATAYIITNTDGDLEPIGTVPVGDNATIDVTEEGVISLRGFASAQTGAQLMKTANGLEWVVPSTETVEGLQTTVGGLITTVGKEATEDEDGNPVASTGLFAQIDAVEADLAAHVADKENPHEVTKDQVGLGNVTNDAQVKRSEMGQANGVATLDADGKVPAAQLPSFVDDVIEAANKAALPTTGEAGKIYVTLDDGKTYRWGGTEYAIISDTIALGETAGTAYEGSKGKALADALNTHTTNADIHFSATERAKLADIEEGAEVNVVDAVSAEFEIGENRTLGVKAIAKEKVTGLTGEGSIEARLASAEGTLSTLLGDGTGAGLGDLAFKSEVAEADLATALAEKINGKLDAADFDPTEFATAAQGEKADSAIQTVKVNGNDLAVTNNAVDVKVEEGTADGHIKVNNVDVAVHGLKSAAYTEASDYATAGHDHDDKYAEKTATETHIGTADIHVTKDQKDAWTTGAEKAGTAVQKITTDNENGTAAKGTITVDGTAVAVKGLGSAAYTEASAYATAAQGSTADTALQSVTVLGKTLTQADSVIDATTAKNALGLSSAAYESKDAFATADHNHDSKYAAKDTTEAHITDGDIHVTAAQKTSWTDAATIVGTLKAVATSGKAADVSIDDTDNKITATTVEGALAELATAIATTENVSKVTVESADSADYSKVYTIKQNGTSVGTINIPKDMVLQSGSVVTLTEKDAAGHEAGIYLKLVLANAENSEIWIPAESLVEYVTGGTHTEGMIEVNVDETTHVVTAKLVDGTVTKAKLHSDVQTSLGKADSALQSVEILGHTLSTATDGKTSVTVAEAKTALGLGSAAYTESTAYDAAGSAAKALEDALAADEKVVLQKYTVATADADDATSFTVAMTPTTGYSFVTGSLAKVIVNGVVYVVAPAAEVTISVGYGLETDDDVYVEFREVKTPVAAG